MIMTEEKDSRIALERIGLTQGEIDAYFSVVGKGVCLISEIAKHAKVKDLDTAKEIVSKLIEKGLLKELPGRTIRFQALPPYAALLNQLETFRDYITELRDEVPNQLKEEFDKFEQGFARVSGLEDFKNFILSVKDEIPNTLTKTFSEFAQRFEKLEALDEFERYIIEMRNSAPAELAKRFESFMEQFEELKGMEQFKNFVSQIQDKAKNELTNRFSSLETEFTELKTLDDLKDKFTEIKTTIPNKLRQSFSNFQEQFKQLAGLTNFKDFVSDIKTNLPQKISTEFAQIEDQFTQLKNLRDFENFVRNITSEVPEQMVQKFQGFEDKFKSVSGLDEFRKYIADTRKSIPQELKGQFIGFQQYVTTATSEVPNRMIQKFQGLEDRFRNVSGLEEFREFIMDLRENIPQELEGQFAEFEHAIRGIKTEILATTDTTFGSYAKIMGDIFEDFINSFVSDVVVEKLENLRALFQEKVLEGVQSILSKVLLRTKTMSQEVLDSFNQIRDWLMDDVVRGLKETLGEVNTQVTHASANVSEGLQKVLSKVLLKTQTMSQEIFDSFQEIRNWLLQEIITGLKTSLEEVNKKVINASSGVTEGFNRLKDWITVQVTSDLENTLTEVESGAASASEKVINAISTLQKWFDEKVVTGLEMIMSNMESKLAEVATKAAESLNDVQSWFIKDAIEGIESTLAETQASVEKVQAELKESLETLQNWFRSEAINQLEDALDNVSGRIQGASHKVTDEFAQLKNWVSEDVIVTIKNTMDDVTEKVQTASTQIDKEVEKLKMMFQGRVVDNTFRMLSGIEDRLWESEATMKAFWDKALSEVSFRFQEVWFVQGADAMIGEISQVVDRVKSKLYIVAPRLEDIDFVPINALPDRINVRIAANIDPKSEEELKILKEYIDHPNFAFRHYPDENIWGVSKDLEEIILGAVSGLDVAGIGSVIDEHIKNFNPVLEGAWMKGRPIKSLDDAQMIQVKRIPRQIRREMMATTTNIPATTTTSPVSLGSDGDAVDGQFSQLMSDSFKAKKKEASEQIIAKINEVKNILMQKPTKGELGTRLEALKEFIINSYGFSRLVFDVSKVSRKMLHEPKKELTDMEISDIENNLEAWSQRI